MNRMEFMSILAAKLSDISEGERREAIQYYEDYLNDAGVENEQEVMDALGSPAQVAENIKAGLGGNSAGEYTETGYQSSKEAKDSVSVRTENPYEKERTRQENNQQPSPREKDSTANTVLKVVLIVLACIFFIPVIIPVGASVVATIAALAVALLAVWFGLMVSGIVMMLCGFIAFFVGAVRVFTDPLSGALLMGVGLFVFGLGILLTILMTWICMNVIPPIFRGIVNLCRKPFQRKERKS